ncbi:mammalian ependymin-related 1-like [Brachionus plicatilis]|uniref:Mammalian ependymin-related 1-like n=1 Tax=Brachionus plicatilis TaxID=10195 RepID=A0A3M7SF43_BRAPC|nr:mammalian ependymin-related 1-like [Brachionus plicatilis]
MKLFCVFCILFFGLILVNCDLSDKPEACKTPEQWQGSFYSYDSIKQIRIIGNISYDAVNKRERIFQLFILPQKNQSYDMLYLYNQKSLQVNNLVKKSCSKISLTRPWTDFGILPNSKFFGSNYLGSNKLDESGLKIQTWKDEFDDSDGNRVFHVSTWTFKNCLPVFDNYITKGSSLHTMYMDITPGIKDESVFESSEVCDETKMD